MYYSDRETKDILNLWRAVVLKAVEDSLRHKALKPGQVKGWLSKEYREAHNWIMGRDPGFLSICEVIGVDPGPIIKFVENGSMAEFTLLRPGINFKDLPN